MEKTQLDDTKDKRRDSIYFLYFTCLPQVLQFLSQSNALLSSPHMVLPQLGGEVKACDSPGFLSDLSHGSEGNY